MPAPDDTLPLDGVALAELVAAGEVSPSELVETAIARAESVNGDINAVIHPLYDQARAAAVAMDGRTGELPGADIDVHRRLKARAEFRRLVRRHRDR